ncbi:MAG: hypothetical protein HZA28_08520 [Candidatus Omnitrophica bacterium]|nr:hypothetical protein [Candidatus Omnitrophota bacterium]
MSNIQKISLVYTLLVLHNLRTVEEVLKKNENFKDITVKERDVILKELMFYYFHICDRFFSEWYEEEKDKIMSRILDRIGKSSDEIKDEDIEKAQLGLSLASFPQFLKILRESLSDDWLSCFYNNRQAYYSRHQFLPKDSKSMRETIDWQFAKNTAREIGRNDDFVFVSKIMTIGMYFYADIQKIESHLREQEVN